MAGIVIKTNLPGRILGMVKHTNRQKHTVKTHEGEYISKIILHSDRKESACTRITNISEEVLVDWTSDNSPGTMDPRVWKKLNDHNRIAYYVSLFDEGFGVNFEYLA